jgi:hypothetical protein
VKPHRGSRMGTLLPKPERIACLPRNAGNLGQGALNIALAAAAFSLTRKPPPLT